MLSIMLSCASCGSGKTPSANGAARNGPSPVICYSDLARAVVRLSAVFIVKNPRDMSEPWRLEFRRYLGRSGNEGAVLVTCDSVTVTDSPTELKKRADELRAKNKRVVETGWTYAN